MSDLLSSPERFVVKPALLIVDADLSTRALVEASLDVEFAELTMARDVVAARELLENLTPTLTLLAGDLDAAAELLVEMGEAPVLWLGAEGGPEAEMAAEVLSKPLDIVSLQMALERHLDTASPVPEPRAFSLPNTGDVAFRAVEAERDALRAEIAVLRHEWDESKRHTADAAQTTREDLEATVAQLRSEVAEAQTALEARAKTAEALQKAYGEVEQAHGNLLQRYEALEAERDAVAERARDVSLLREQLELSHRDHVREKAELEARLADASTRADNATRALGLRASDQSDLAGLVDEAGWWQEALQEATD